MNAIDITLNEYFYYLLGGGFLVLVAVMIPVQVVSKIRRMRRKRTRIVCRICGFRFLRSENQPVFLCPHCGAKNKS